MGVTVLRRLVALEVLLAALSIACGSGAAPTATATKAPTATPSRPLPTATPAATSAAATPVATPRAATTTPVPAPVAAVPQGSITVFTGNEPDQMDPHKSGATPAGFFRPHIIEGLFTRGDRGVPVPQLATAFEVSPDQLTYTFKLRSGVIFHNGDPFSGEDVRYAVERILAPATKSPSAGDISRFVASVDLPTKDSVAFRFKQKDPLFLTRLGFGIIPREYDRSLGEGEFAKKPVGSGPFRLIERVPQDHLTLEANTGYRGTPPTIKRVTFRFSPEATTRIAALRVGEVDLIDGVPPTDVAGLKARSELWVRTITVNEGQLILINTRSKPEAPHANKLVRQAMNYAVDKQAIINRLLLGTTPPMASALPAALPGRDPALTPYPYDAAKAKQLMAQAGYTSGFDAKIFYPQGRYILGGQVVEAVSSYLREIGIRATPEPIEIGAWAQRMFAQDDNAIYPMTLTANVNTSWDPLFTFEAFLYSKRTLSHYLNPELDRLIEESTNVFGFDERDQFFRRLERLVYDDPPYIFLYENVNTFAGRTRLVWEPQPGYQGFRMWEARLRN